MILSQFCIYCILELLFNYCEVLGDDEPGPYHRFIVEEGFKPPIFGSYHYDPLKQEFELPQREEPTQNITQSVSHSDMMSTALGTVDTTEPGLRHRVIPTTSAPILKWGKGKETKTTKNPHMKNRRFLAY